MNKEQRTAEDVSVVRRKEKAILKEKGVAASRGHKRDSLVVAASTETRGRGMGSCGGQSRPGCSCGSPNPRLATIGGLPCPLGKGCDFGASRRGR